MVGQRAIVTGLTQRPVLRQGTMILPALVAHPTTLIDDTLGHRLSLGTALATELIEDIGLVLIEWIFDIADDRL
jgi:hypothetical protein